MKESFETKKRNARKNENCIAYGFKTTPWIGTKNEIDVEVVLMIQ